MEVAGCSGAGQAGPASKQSIREKIWAHLEASGLAEFPRPVHHRIPNFKGSHQACQAIKELEIFDRTREIKVDPDKPLEGVRLAALQARKTLLVPTPRLRTGLFNQIVPPLGATKEILRKCATSQGVKDYSVPIGLDAKVKVDLVVVGSVAVSEKGWRIGKGEGYADMEYAMMVSMGAVTEDTPVVTIVHDCQVVDIPEELLGDHDLTVDYILTPTRTIKTNCKRLKPKGIIWQKVSYEILGKIPILKNLRYREKQAGKDVTLQDEHPDFPNASIPAVLEDTAKTENTRPHTGTSPAHIGHCSPGNDSLSAKSDVPGAFTTVYVGNLPAGTRVSELKSTLRELHVTPLRLNWQGAQHRAFLDYKDKVTAESAVSSLKGLSLGGCTLRVELAKNQRSKGQVEINRNLAPQGK
ncbi:methenyltetrahydrofolate synthase domain-containing protein isoform X1 [Alligator mississippiensis]|uniref:Methenyltetrahydrofolate synthase domain-containing protein n=1 Tax=Alligator mississippiensis TaxID=8496 RepID=A0A151NMB2_ALLMI|nr:methenyltetrahydrofolate synthase domain-containing protein isoform X1 [Alligator mississippiensis]KYO37923.1 methenyltetrahydrofolate synthase domain-containing protein isoform B [Alligator mississippiensis]